jgi:hypothetical protein
VIGVTVILGAMSWMNRWVALLMVAAFLAACGSGSTPPGTVTGGIRLQAGTTSAQQVKSYSFEHRAGTVLISRDGKQIKSAQVGNDHAYKVLLSPGSYSVSAKVSGFICDPTSVAIAANHRTEIEVVCSDSTPIG